MEKKDPRFVGKDSPDEVIEIPGLLVNPFNGEVVGEAVLKASMSTVDNARNVTSVGYSKKYADGFANITFGKN